MAEPSHTTTVTSHWDSLPSELQERILLIARMHQTPIMIEDGMAYLREYAFDKLEAWLRSDPKKRGSWPFSVRESSFLYTIVFTMCTQKPPLNFSVQLYEFLGDQAEAAGAEIAPDTREGTQWTSFFVHLFKYLDRFYIPRVRLPELKELVRSRMALSVAKRA